MPPSIFATDFRKAYRDKKASVSRTTAGGNKSKKKMPWKGIAEVPAGHISQAEAKKMMPPDSYLWRARTCNTWMGRYASLPTKSCKDSAWGGERHALLECIRHTWSVYLDCNGFAETECPINGLFGSSGAASSSA